MKRDLLFREAPHKTPFGRMDEVKAALELVLPKVLAAGRLRRSRLKRDLQASHKTPYGRMDEVKAARELVLPKVLAAGRLREAMS